MADYVATSQAELGTLDDEELAIRVANTRQELFNLRFQAATGQLTNTSRLGQLRREVAQLLTNQRQREIAVAEAYYLSQIQEGSGA
ncbi:MAG: 50S ribosomal protein L29 [Acidimicrobiales bacterium]